MSIPEITPPELKRPRSYPRSKGIGTHWYPIFCTAEIAPEIVDDFLIREYHRRSEQGDDFSNEYFGFYLVTSAFTPPPTIEEREGCFFGDAIRAARVPTSPFTSPYLDFTISELESVFRSLYFGPPFGSSTFIVFDERTKRDRTCRIFADFRGVHTAWCEFGLAAELLNAPEAGMYALTEGDAREEYVDPEGSGELLYTIESVIKVRGWHMTSEHYVERPEEDDF